MTGGRPKASCMAANATSGLKLVASLDNNSGDIDQRKVVATWMGPRCRLLDKVIDGLKVS